MAKTAPHFTKITITCLVVLNLIARVICDESHPELRTETQEEVNPEDTTSKISPEVNIPDEITKGFDSPDATGSTSFPKQSEAVIPDLNLEDKSDSPIFSEQDDQKSNLNNPLKELVNPKPVEAAPSEANHSISPPIAEESEDDAPTFEQPDVLLNEYTGDVVATADEPGSSAIDPDSNTDVSENTATTPKEVSGEYLKGVFVPSSPSSPSEESSEDESSPISPSIIPELNLGENQSDIIQDRVDIVPEGGDEENEETSIVYKDETEDSSLATFAEASPDNEPLAGQPKLSKYSDSEEETMKNDTLETGFPETVDKNSEKTDSEPTEIDPEEISPANLTDLQTDRKLETRTGLKVNESSKNIPESVSAGVILGSIKDLQDLKPLADGDRENRRPGKGLPMPTAPNNRKIENLAEEKINTKNMTRAAKLQSWLQDPYLRAPVALVVPLKPKALNRAQGVWRELVNTTVNLTDLILIGYDDNGIGWLSRHSLQRGSNSAGSNSGASSVTASLVKLLQKQMHRPIPLLKPTEGVLHACARAARLIPYDSAVFVFADEGPKDDTFTERAARVLLAKRLKLYTIWMDPNTQTKQPNDASSILRTVSRETDGDFLPFYPNIEELNIEAERSNQSLEDEKIWGISGTPTLSADDRKMRSNYVLHSYTRDPQEQGIRVMDQTLMFRKGGGGHATLVVPVDGGVSDLRLRIDGTLERAAFYPPTGPQIDLFNGSSVEQFHPGSSLISNSPLDVILKLPSRYDNADMYSVIPANAEQKDPSRARSQQNGGGSAGGRGPLSGVWRLSVRCADVECRYRVLVTARATLGFDATLIGDKMIRLRAHGPVATVRETSLVDEKGNEIAKLPFRHQPGVGEGVPSSDDKLDEELKSIVLVADVPVETLNPNITIYAQAVGRDIYGESFIRMSGPISAMQAAADMELPKGRSAAKTVRSAAVVFSGSKKDVENPDVELIEDNQSDQPVMSRNINATTFATQILTSAGEVLTGVQIGLSTRLYGAPGEVLQLHFEVTNYREQSVYFRFGATGTLNFLRSISPQWQWVNAGQTVNVIVTAGITSNAEIGARDTIIFTATGVDQVTFSSYIYVVSSSGVTALDSWPPTMTHAFQGDCLGKQGEDCASNIWSATITARDPDGGLLRISSSPVGLRYGPGFFSGTREQVTASYRATCCTPRVVLSASDIYGNVNAYTVDISGYLTPATIAAITLGVFLMIAIILIIIFLIWFCVRKRQESRELSYPTARRDT